MYLRGEVGGRNGLSKNFEWKFFFHINFRNTLKNDLCSIELNVLEISNVYKTKTQNKKKRNKNKVKIELDNSENNKKKLLIA